MEQITNTSYILTKEPINFQFRRREDTVLNVTTSYRFVNMQPHGDGINLEFDGGSLTLTQQVRNFRFRWQGAGINVRIPIEGRWFGLGELVNQPWDLGKVSLQLSEVITSDSGATGYSNLMSPVLISESGAALIVHSPFKLGINQLPGMDEASGEYVFGEEVPFDQRPAFDTRGKGDGQITLVGDDLSFDLFILDDPLSAHRLVVEEVGHPDRTPPLELFGAPVWTTWAQYKDEISEEIVLDFAREIISNRFPYQVLEIDDKWQTTYGDIEFDPHRFPTPHAMIQRLHEEGFKVTCWVHPFLHPQSKAAAEGAEKGYLMKNQDGEPYLIKWWQGKGYLLDATNPDAMEWFGGNLRALQEKTGLDGYKFDGAEAIYVPKDAVLHKPGDSRNRYSHDYVDWVAHNYSLCEVRTGWQNQTSPILFRLWDLWSTWGEDNGLRAIIPATLQLSLIGYPFTLPDMIGGNGYFTFPKNKLLLSLINKVIIPAMERSKQESTGDEDVGVHASDVPEFIAKKASFGWPTAELMIRWTQLNTLIPVMQFSITPWQFGEECNDICRKYTELHLEFTPLFEQLAENATVTGEPIVRPVFFLAPDDSAALDCAQQFLIGNDLLVAPVVERGARKRDIYFPPGNWRDHWTGEIYHGPQKVKDFPAPLDMLPFFHREE
jgi:alpha-glucosidase (family GH31 glycosyl hydrolase)